MQALYDADAVDRQLDEERQQIRDELIEQGRLLQEDVATAFATQNPWLRYTAAEGVMRRFVGGRWQVDETLRTKDDVRHYCQAYFLPGTAKPREVECWRRPKSDPVIGVAPTQN